MCSDFIFVDHCPVAIRLDDIVCVAYDTVYTRYGQQINLGQSRGSTLRSQLLVSKQTESVKIRKENELLRSDIQVLKNKLQTQYDLDPDSHSAELEAARKRFTENAAAITAVVDQPKVIERIKE